MKKIVVKKYSPMWTDVYTTEDHWEDDLIEDGIVKARKGDMKTYQTVVAVGHTCTEVKVGDLVKINLQRYMVPMYKDNSIKNDMVGQENVVTYQVDKETINGKSYLHLQERDIAYIVEEYEEVDVKDSSEVIISD